MVDLDFRAKTWLLTTRNGITGSQESALPGHLTQRPCCAAVGANLPRSPGNSVGIRRGPRTLPSPPEILRMVATLRQDISTLEFRIPTVLCCRWVILWVCCQAWVTARVLTKETARYRSFNNIPSGFRESFRVRSCWMSLTSA